MQIPGLLNALPNSVWHMIIHDGASKIILFLSAVASLLLLSNTHPPNAYAHVSHVLSAQQYADIKSGYPDIEIIAAGLTGFIVLSAILIQSFQKYRRGLKIC